MSGALFSSAVASVTAPSSSSLAAAQLSPSSNFASAMGPSSSSVYTNNSVAMFSCMQRRFNASDAASSDSTSGGTALDVAMKVNKLKRMHQTGQGQGKKEVERMAWRELNTLSEQQIATAEGKAVALLLNSWAYFARFWEKGKDGPYDVNAENKSEDKN